MGSTLQVIRNRNIAVLLSGRIISVSGDWLFQIALSIAVYRYSNGSSSLIGLLWLTRLVPRLLLGPLAGALADRLGYRPSMLAADLGRMVLVGFLALTLTQSTWGIIYPIVFAVTCLGSLFSPASIGLIPSLVSSPQEKLSANALIMQAEAVAGVAGSALGGIIAAQGWITQLLLAEAATFGVSALSLWLLRPRPVDVSGPEEAPPLDAEEDVGGGLAGGYRLLTRRPLLAFTAFAMALPELASGAILVWIVPYSFHALHQGASGIGYLYAALGIGAVIGGLVAGAIGGAVRLDALLVLGIVAGGIAITLFGVVHVTVLALLMLLCAGMAETVEYAAYETLLQQVVPEDLIGKVAGTMESFFFGMMLVGNLISGPLASRLGLPIAIGGLGILTALAALAAWWNLRRVTRGQPSALDLARVPAFAGMSTPLREWAVRRMLREEIAPGAVLIQQGDVGDTFYAITRGSAEVEIDGKIQAHQLGPGDFVGEIALLHHVPRTATVRALAPLTVYALGREDFDELRVRASDFKQSLLETAAARLERDPNLATALAARS